MLLTEKLKYVHYVNVGSYKFLCIQNRLIRTCLLRWDNSILR